ncbi:MAG TPA: hypothetical protein VJM84_04120 [Actinomycetota bacterium]|nr:hypothetical protein [Actinomycetota bacterium]
MAHIFVEGWSPEYGAALDADALAPAEGSVDDTVEGVPWSGRDGVDDGIRHIAFIDGVRRIDARLTIDDPQEGPVPGLCGTFAVGAVRWNRSDARSHVGDERVERWAVLAGGRAEIFPPVDLRPAYETITIPDRDGDALVHALQSRMRAAEGHLAATVATDAFVFADGPLNELAPQQVVGTIKSHRVTYLPPERGAIVASLGVGQRTPLFTIADYRRYSWYVRLAILPGGHSWTGIVRCEASGHLPLGDVVTIADRTAALLPLLASDPHIDPRAPQNLVPIGALERQLRHRMGDAGLVYRALRAAVTEQRVS